MNIKISPIVRCTYEAEENALRLVLKEPIAPHDPAAANSSDPSALEIVVYALKVSIRSFPKGWGIPSDLHILRRSPVAHAPSKTSKSSPNCW